MKKSSNMIIFIAGLIIGAVLDNRFAPKVKMADGKITFEWTDKKKAQNDPNKK